MINILTTDQIKMCVEGCEAKGDTSSALYSIAFELLERRKREEEAARARFEARDHHEWTNAELRIHADNAEWLTRTIALDLLELRKDADGLIESGLKLFNTFRHVLTHPDLAESREKFPDRFSNTIGSIERLIADWSTHKRYEDG